MVLIEFDNPALYGAAVYVRHRLTDEPVNAYMDAAATMPHCNPIILDAEGRGEIYLDPLLLDCRVLVSRETY